MSVRETVVYYACVWNESKDAVVEYNAELYGSKEKLPAPTFCCVPMQHCMHRSNEVFRFAGAGRRARAWDGDGQPISWNDPVEPGIYCPVDFDIGLRSPQLFRIKACPFCGMEVRVEKARDLYIRRRPAEPVKLEEEVKDLLDLSTDEVVLKARYG